MKSIKFKQSTKRLQGMVDSKGNRKKQVFVKIESNGQVVSCWRVNLLQRILFLFHGRIWLGVHDKGRMPPVWLQCGYTVFSKPKKVVNNGDTRKASK